jgi:uncharacterized membrane protein YeaQ/YmgE (transglycosylase-associated protein family)
MWVCNTTALCAMRWTAAWMNMAVGSTGWQPASCCPAALHITIGTGWISYLNAGFIGACILIAIARLFRR